ncbi:protein of unknown function [Candidatus Filomicrobium marinum]|uniref:Uncharacterized protein n=1 Tax=Candidatus Filomicrobium marinum TaxID=1608628 RepID=A0A0D6JII2_9HYPH|nr:protein of unknown function [Candidatus Filomicrobium marinum]CPR21734.1 protein of unknown function [Candidatus Filomicrobium marinum]
MIRGGTASFRVAWYDRRGFFTLKLMSLDMLGMAESPAPSGRALRGQEPVPNLKRIKGSTHALALCRHSMGVYARAPRSCGART